MSDNFYSSNIDELLFSVYLLVFSLWRVSKSQRISLIKSFTGNLRSLTTLLALMSMLGLTIYNTLFLYLSLSFELDKNVLQDYGSLVGSYSVEIKKYPIDLVTVLNVSYYLSGSFFNSILFLLIGIWMECISKVTISQNSNPNRVELGEGSIKDHGKLILDEHIRKKASSGLIYTISILYSLLRMPLTIFLDFHRFSNTPFLAFYRQVFYCCETVLFVILIFLLQNRLIGNIKDSKCSKNVQSRFETINLLICLLLVGATKLIIPHVVQFDQKVKSMFNFHNKIDGYIFLSVRMLIISMLCPLSPQILDEDANNTVKSKAKKELVRHEQPNKTIIEFNEVKKKEDWKFTNKNKKECSPTVK